MSIRIVIDTNVLIGALIGKEYGANRKLLELCLKGEFKPLISYTLFSEYEDLINRPSILKLCKRSPEEINILFDGLLGVCELVKIYYLWRPNLVDEGDNYLVELAIAGNAEILVTHNVKDFQRSQLKFPQLKIKQPQEII
ncbi:MAG: putative toxin-antitoxin system toxin component, PIN family [Pleurocapsa sp. SU_5_0]|nr:putative toxin-antitoxin system toxin component, PIN family [Pleurocapsa sp. SU_5_0]NJO98145.1 putative toxin-antitoxin system toxin component, PIN family [Pleurocapsa sp. CRU_1_2]